MSRQPAPAHQSTPVGLWLAAAELMFVLFVGDVDADDDDVFTLSCSVRLTLKDQERAKEAGGRERERRSQQPADWTDRQLTGWFISLISSDVLLKVISFMFCRMNWSQVTAEVQQKKNISMWSNVHVTEKLVRKQPANRLQTGSKQAPNSQSSWTIELITFPLQNQQLTEEKKRTDEGWRVNVMEGEEEEDEGLGGVWCAETDSLNEICSPSEILEETVCDVNTELRSHHRLLDSEHVSLKVQKNEHQAVWATVWLVVRAALG